MTRDQAIKAAHQALAREHGSDHGLDGFGHQAESMVDALEALGLIKLDKDERDEGRRFVRQMARVWSESMNPGDAIVEDIEKAGFKIVRAQ